MTRTALVTGATRGIGRAVAVALARRGYDVALTGRTRQEGDAALPGSLREVARDVEAVGRRSLPIYMDLLDRDSLHDVARQAIDGLGHVDVVLANAIYVSPGGPEAYLDTSLEELERRMFGNLTAQLIFLQPVVAHMVSRGGGTVGLTGSAVAHLPPRSTVDGGWALTYGVSKAGLARIPAQLHAEHPELRSMVFEPGAVATERVQSDPSLGHIARVAAPVHVVGEVMARVLDGEGAEIGPETAIDVGRLARSWDLL